MTDTLLAAEKFLLKERTVTLTSALLPAEECRAVAEANAPGRQCGRDEAAKLCAAMLTAMKIRTDLMDYKEKIAATEFCGRIAAMSWGTARHLTLIAAGSNTFGVPAKVDMPKLEKMAEARRQSLESLAAAMSREIERRAAAAAVEEKIEADRALMTPEQRRAHVDAKLKEAGFR